jgi:hypothetical protein
MVVDVKAAALVDLAKAAVRVRAVLVKAVPAAHVPADGRAVRADLAKAAGSFSAARRFANSASRRSTASTTRTFGCSRDLSPRLARSCLAV